MNSDIQRELTARVRQNVVSAGIAALLLLYFGYAGGGVSTLSGLSTPAWLGSELTVYAMKIGGPAMLLAAVLSMSGMSLALLIDALASVAIGFALGLGGVLMGITGGFGMQDIIYLVCGFMFVSSGLRNGREYFLWTQSGTDRGESRDPRAAYVDEPVAPPAKSLASQLRHRSMNAANEQSSDERPEPIEARSKNPPPAEARCQDSPPTRSKPPSPSLKPPTASQPPPPKPKAPIVSQTPPPATPSPSEPAPEGFLASFSKKPAPPQE